MVPILWHLVPPMVRQAPLPPTTASADTKAEAVERLIEAVNGVAEQMQLLWNTIDEIREEFAWALRNDRLTCSPSVMHVTSMAADPCAPDWGKRLNRSAATDLPPEASSLTPSAEPGENDDAPADVPPPPPTAEAIVPPLVRATRRQPGKKRKPLYSRLYYKEQYIEVVRILGYGRRPLADVQKEMNPLLDKYGKEAMKEVQEEIVVIDTGHNPPIAWLTDEARKLARPILGEPPAATAVYSSEGQRKA